MPMRVYRLAYRSFDAIPPRREVDAVLLAGRWHEVPADCASVPDAEARAVALDDMVAGTETILRQVRELPDIPAVCEVEEGP